jgi:hypothetical protein
MVALGLAVTAAWGQDQGPSGTFIEGQPIPMARQSAPAPAGDVGAAGRPATAGQALDAGEAGVGGDAADAAPLPLNQRADELISVLGRMEGALADLVAPVPEDELDRQDQRQERELAAREAAAFWAMATFWVALGAVLLAAIAVYAMLRSLQHARGVAADIIDEARETTRAVASAADQASRISDLAERAVGSLGRPYVIPIVVDHNLPKYVTAKGSAEQELSASIIYKNSGSSPAVLKKIAPIASTIPATSDPEPLNPFYSNRELFLELGACHLEPGQATSEISVSCSLPKRVRELAAARGVSFSSLTGDAAKVVLQDRLTYTDLLGNETVLYVRYDYVLGFFELIQIREERGGLRESVERIEHERTRDAAE